MPRRKRLGMAIRAEREAQNISQHRLALMIGNETNTYLSDVENGYVSIGFDRLCSIADALDRDVSFFLRGM